MLSLAALTISGMARAASVEGISFTSLPNEGTRIELEFDGPVPETSGYSIDQPARIADLT
ncbi:MAG: hypothetical protein U5R48_10855 [Gammaproteobacteria bacterium]|nr:hypothetical protein [Gammaproteobacteria bacterium]